MEVMFKGEIVIIHYEVLKENCERNQLLLPMQPGRPNYKQRSSVDLQFLLSHVPSSFWETLEKEKAPSCRLADNLNIFTIHLDGINFLHLGVVHRVEVPQQLEILP